MMRLVIYLLRVRIHNSHFMNREVCIYPIMKPFNPSRCYIKEFNFHHRKDWFLDKINYLRF